MSLNVATFLLQWAVGGLAFLWVTTRRREVGLGYGWLLRSIYIVLALAAALVGRSVDPAPVRDTVAVLTALAAGVALAVSIVCRRAGVRLGRERVEGGSARVAAMPGIDREDRAARFDPEAREFPPALDLVAPRSASSASSPPASTRVTRPHCPSSACSPAPPSSDASP